MALIKSAPASSWRRTAPATSSTPRTGSPTTSAWPPAAQSARPHARIRGPSTIPSSTASRRWMMCQSLAPQSRTVVTPARSISPARRAARSRLMPGGSVAKSTSGEGPPSSCRCTWQLKSPGITTRPSTSITRVIPRRGSAPVPSISVTSQRAVVIRSEVQLGSGRGSSPFLGGDLESIAIRPVERDAEVHRLAVSAEVDALDLEHRLADFHAQRSGESRVRQRGRDRLLHGRQLDPILVLQDGRHRPMRELGILVEQWPPDGLGDERGGIERRMVVDHGHAVDRHDRGVDRNLQPAREARRRRDQLLRHHPRVSALPELHDRIEKATHLGLDCGRLANIEGATALLASNEPFLLEEAERLLHGDAARAELAAELDLRR